MLKKIKDCEIVVMIQNGGKSCEQAGDYLYHVYKPIIFHFARQHGAKEEDIFDIFAETMSSCILNIAQKKFVLDRPLGVYIKVIYARKTIKYVFRQEKTIKNIVSSLQNSEDSDILTWIDLQHQEDPYDIILENELKSKMHRALRYINEKCRLLFELTFQNTPMKNIGEALIEKGLIQDGSDPENAAKSQHKRCKSDLKQLISTKFPELVEYYLK